MLDAFDTWTQAGRSTCERISRLYAATDTSREPKAPPQKALYDLSTVVELTAVVTRVSVCDCERVRRILDQACLCFLCTVYTVAVELSGG